MDGTKLLDGGAFHSHMYSHHGGFPRLLEFNVIFFFYSVLDCILKGVVSLSDL